MKDIVSAFNSYCYICSHVSLIFIAAVQRVSVSQLNATAVNVSWTILMITDVQIDHYTVVYRPMTGQIKRESGKMSAVFPSHATFGVITNLHSAVTYQFQVFATVIVNGTLLDGETNPPINITRE